MVQPAHKGQTLQKQKLTDLLEMGVDNDPVPVHCNGYDGQGGHEHSYAGEGLNQSVKINTQNRFYFLQNVLSDQIGNVCNTKTEQKNYLQLKLKKHFKYQISLQFHAGYDVAQQPHRIGSLIIFGSGWEILYFAQDHLSSFHHNVFLVDYVRLFPKPISPIIKATLHISVSLLFQGLSLGIIVVTIYTTFLLINSQFNSTK